MSTDAHWNSFFEQWPDDLPRRGVLVTDFGEQIPFATFLTGQGLLLIERQTPDTAGARQVVLAYSSIVGLKITDVVKTSALARFGFKEARPAVRRDK